MKFLIAYKDGDEVMIRTFSTRKKMLEFAELCEKSGTKILCVWTEGI